MGAVVAMHKRKRSVSTFFNDPWPVTCVPFIAVFVNVVQPRHGLLNLRLVHVLAGAQRRPCIRCGGAGSKEDVLKSDPVPNDKTDTNNYGPFSTDDVGMNYEYPEGSIPSGVGSSRSTRAIRRA